MKVFWEKIMENNKIENEKYLPIGTIVKLKNGNKKLMITCRRSASWRRCCGR